MASEAWRTIGKAGLVSGLLSLLLGGFLLWACQSWHVLVWLQTKQAFPNERTRIVMVNTGNESSRSLLAKHQVKENNLALRALILNDSDKLIATAWREAYLQIPENSDKPPYRSDQASQAVLDALYIRWLTRMEAGNIFAWVLFCIVSPTMLIAVRSWTKQRSRGIGSNLHSPAGSSVSQQP